MQAREQNIFTLMRCEQIYNSLENLFTCGVFPLSQSDFFSGFFFSKPVGKLWAAASLVCVKYLHRYIESFSIYRVEVVQDSSFCLISVAIVFTAA